MKWYITRKRLLAIIVVLFLTLAAFGMWGCTQRQEKDAKETGGTISRMVGLPPFVGEAIAAAICAAIGHLNGERRGRRKERSCHVPKAQPAKVDTP
jgi:hypothetical protein